MGDISDTFKSKYYNNDTRDEYIKNNQISNIGLSQWQTPFNKQQQQLIYSILADIPRIGMQYNDIYQAQSVEDASQVLRRLFGIAKYFSDITLTEEELAKLVNMLAVYFNATNVVQLYSGICKIFDKGYWMIEQGYVYFIIQDSLNLIKAMVQFGMFFSTLGTHLAVVLVPKEIDLEKQKLWWIPHTSNTPEWEDNFYYPNYTSSLKTNNISIRIQPEWIYFIY